MTRQFTEEQRRKAKNRLLFYYNECEYQWEKMSSRLEKDLNLDEESVAELLREEASHHDR